MIAISNDDVSRVARALDCTFEDPHVKFLTATSSTNVHACPGSGKTTLLVAKLAILAGQWPWRDRGILVLSHTNVARREVERRLYKEPSAAKLLGYPHFIGTIQGFVDKFLALPFLRDVGVGGVPVEDARVDDDLFAERAVTRFCSNGGWKNYPQARAWAKKQRDEGLGTIATLYYEGPDAVLNANVPKIPKPESPTGRQLRALKDRLSAEGIFRYADMFAFAAASLVKHPFIRAAIRRRFAWVFVDEMQDTSDAQETFLDGIFDDGSVVFNKIGDKNQAIFAEAIDESAQRELMWANAIDLPQSQRLAPKLARLVSPLAVVHPLKLQGNGKRKDRAHTVFLFDETTISRVLPAFGDLILKEWGGVLPAAFVAKAVGFRRRPPSKPSIPGCLVDYWSDFEGRPAEDRPPSGSLLSAVRHARRLAEVSGEFFDAHRAVCDALARLLELHEGIRFTRRSLMDRCRDGSLDEQGMKEIIARLLRSDCVSGGGWEEIVTSLCNVLARGKRAPEVVGYLAWEDEAVAPKTAAKRGHVFVHCKADKSVSIEVATIHAVKGETHDATLVLETQFHEHDVGLALPVLLGGSAKTGARFVGHMKRLFVASTRPKELLCFALHQDRATPEQVTALRGMGWSVENLVV